MEFPQFKPLQSEVCKTAPNLHDCPWWWQLHVLCGVLASEVRRRDGRPRLNRADYARCMPRSANRRVSFLVTAL